MTLARKVSRKHLVRVKVIAEILDIPRSSVYEAARANPPRIGGVVRIGRSIRFDLDKFNAWLDEGGEALPNGQDTASTERVEAP